MAASGSILPLKYQPALPMERLIVAEAPGDDALPMDVLIVGGGPAGLACAIKLKQLAAAAGTEVEVGVLEKAAELGGHCLSGAVINPRALRELFPDVAESDLPFRKKVESDSVYLMTKRGQFKLPTPPTMNNHGNYVASLCEVVRWMGEQAEGLGINLFPGYPADSLLVDGTRVVGARTAAAGLERDGSPGSNYTPPTDVAAQVTVLAEGTRGPLTQGFLQWQKIPSPNPQIFALGVKEIWETKKVPTGVIHTMGWPLPTDAFGGSFLYPMADNLVAFGLVVGLDYHDASLDVHGLLQRLKQHPLFAQYLDGGTLVEWGAKTIPEGGYHSLPARHTGDGLIVIGDAGGLVDVPSLKGIHYAIQSGIYAAETIFEALQKGETAAANLAPYDQKLRASYVISDMHKTRNMRLAFKGGFYAGGFQAGLMTITGGAFPGGKITIPEDAAVAKTLSEKDGALPKGALSKLDAVYHSGNQTRDDIPSHLIIGVDVPGDVADLYSHMCPAGVYERQGDTLVVNAPNCVDCKATDVLGPRWTPREGGSGPSYKRM